ncbi:MAG TPA: hypothetical protein VKZ74_01550 [Natronosporangium sp.]|nr:hypothetical protein [Natronosporangium sp.]
MTRISPIRRLLSLAVAAFAGMVGVGLIFGAQTAGLGPLRLTYAAVLFGIQVLVVLALSMALRPPGTRVVAVAGLATAVAADLAAVLPNQATVRPLAIAAAGGFLLGVAGQLRRPEGRIRMTEAVTAALAVALGVTAYAMLVVLTRVTPGTQVLTAGLAAAGLALMVARVVDTVVPWPRLSPQVPRGALGVVLGPMTGTVAAAFLGGYLVGLSPTSGALVGLAAALSAVLADLSTGYAEAGRRMAGEPPTMWIARHLQGPLAGFAVAAVVVYAVNVLFLAPHY